MSARPRLQWRALRGDPAAMRPPLNHNEAAASLRAGRRGGPALAFAECVVVAGIAFRGVNTSLLDGFDIAFTKLLFNEFLGAAVEFYPYPDTSSLCARPLCTPALRVLTQSRGSSQLHWLAQRRV